MKNVYFLSDAHLGSWAIPHRRTQERRIVRFLDSIKDKAGAVYLLGDMFDFLGRIQVCRAKGLHSLPRQALGTDRPWCGGAFLHGQPRYMDLRLFGGGVRRHSPSSAAYHGDWRQGLFPLLMVMGLATRQSSSSCCGASSTTASASVCSTLFILGGACSWACDGRSTAG